MRISSSLLKHDINNVTIFNWHGTVNNSNSKIDYDITLHTPNIDLPIRLLKFIEVKRDYNNNLGDDIRVCFLVKASEYINYILKHKDHIEISVRKKSLSYVTRRYKAFILKDDADTIKQNINSMDKKSLDALYPIELEMQLVEMGLYGVMNIKIESTYLNENLEKVLYSELSSNARYFRARFESSMTPDIVELDNKKIYGNIIIPSGTSLLKLPTYLQDDDKYGLYNGGVGTYIQQMFEHNRNYLYVYPLFSPSRYDKETVKLHIYQDKNLKSGLDKTYLLDGDVLKIVPRYETSILDMGEAGLKINGDTLIVGKTDNNTKAYRGDDEEISSNTKNNVEVMGIKDNPDGVNTGLYVGNTNNVYKYRTQILRNVMSIYTFQWDSSNIDLIYPGMPCAIFYEDNSNEVVVLKGTVQGTAEIFTKEHKKTSGTITVAVVGESIYQTLSQQLED